MFGFFKLIFKRSNPTIRILLDDIVDQDVSCIVNASDEALCGGTGVDGAIHEAAGEQLAVACRALGGCGIGRVKVTAGFNLSALWILHTVAPVWSGEESEEDILIWCYLNCFKEAERLGAQTIAFPTLGAGAFGWPTDIVAQVAMRAVDRYRFKRLKEIRFIAFSQQDFKIWQETLGVEGQVIKTNLWYHKGVSA